MRRRTMGMGPPAVISGTASPSIRPPDEPPDESSDGPPDETGCFTDSDGSRFMCTNALTISTTTATTSTSRSKPISNAATTPKTENDIVLTSSRLRCIAACYRTPSAISPETIRHLQHATAPYF
ncbi:hypothetical protein BREU_2078 [Bifidobacterium reuteri DSM 23975]|uniref:Uncharacterized protein n=1 Tax=Bifidobacterium reuteri DSM 23975 TaxID=1437610 RepID=A0A087CPK2_9BIFI|nr:hypothetical protein BREU_2078 [Bifidobacterium reuteri DSM 23975]